MSTGNYNKHEIVINVEEIGRKALRITLPLIFLYTVMFFLLWPEKFTLTSFGDAFPENPLITIGLILGGIFMHELLHGVTWALFCNKGFRSICFGIWLKMLTPYTHCKEPLKKYHYFAGGLMPGLLLGIIPAVMGIIQGNMGYLLFGTLFSFAAGGDFAMMWKLSTIKKSSLLLDHPEKLGCYLYEKQQTDYQSFNKTL